MNTLVVVTCCRDYWNFEMLCRSFHSFLDPANIVIIINESDEYVKIWKSFYKLACKRLLKKHKITVFSRQEIYNFEVDYNHTCGWVHQQILKILISQHINDDEYLVLDSKNFLFKRTSVEGIKQTKPSTDWMLPDVEQFCIEACRTFNVDYTGKSNFPVTQNITPYMIQNDVAKKLVEYFHDKKGFYDWIQSLSFIEHIAPTEFIAYEVFAKKINKEKKHGLCDQNSCTIWQHLLTEHKVSQLHKYVLEQNTLFDVKVSGIHSGVHNLLSLDDVKGFLRKLGVPNILPMYSISPFK